MGMEWLLGGSKKTTIPEVANAAPWLQQAQMVQFGADRGRLMSGLEGMYDTSRNAYNTGVQALPGQISNMDQQLQGISGQVGGNANQLTQMAGYNPYMQYYANPAATKQEDLTARNAAIEAAYGNYGSLGGQYQQQSGLMSSNAAARGVGNSGYARRMQEDLAGRKAAAESEARNKAIGESNQYLLNAGQLYNQGRQLGQGAAQAAGQLNLGRGELATQAPKLNLQAAGLYGDQANKSGQLWSQGQSEKRNAQQAVNDYNTQGFNKATGDYFQGYNNRNIQQASLDANRQQTGLIPTLMNAASMALPFFGGRN